MYVLYVICLYCLHLENMISLIGLICGKFYFKLDEIIRFMLSLSECSLRKKVLVVCMYVCICMLFYLVN